MGRRRTFPVRDAEKPGGSRMEEADFDFGFGGEWSSRTHDGYDGFGFVVVIFGWDDDRCFGTKWSEDE